MNTSVWRVKLITLKENLHPFKDSKKIPRKIRFEFAIYTLTLRPRDLHISYFTFHIPQIPQAIKFKNPRTSLQMEPVQKKARFAAPAPSSSFAPTPTPAATATATATAAASGPRLHIHMESSSATGAQPADPGTKHVF